MNSKRKILFLGCGRKETILIKFLEKKNINIILLGQKKIDTSSISAADILISFGYRTIISKKVLKKLNNPPINLHMSYLPYNKGSHPNFWSFYDKTPAGITIHEVNEKLDSGKIIFQKKIKFKLNRKTSFYSTYKILFKELEKLFCRHYKKIINSNYKSKPQIGKGTFHLKKNLPKNVKWKESIFKYLDNLK